MIYAEYIDNILSGEIPACKWVKLACKRHLDDLATGEERGLWFDDEAAQHAIDFFGFLRHSKGEWAGRVVELEPWQQFKTAMIFGWMREDVNGNIVRRFRSVYIEVPRKNGKTLWAAGIGLYLLDADGEPGAEIYAAATKKDQAKLVHSDAVRMVKASPTLRGRMGIHVNNIHVDSTNSKFEPVGRDSDTMDGLNVHCAIIDELHAHPSGDTYGVLDTATGSRRQPVMLVITTAGFNQESFCYERRDYVTKVLDGKVDDDSLFGIIYTRDEGDGWENPETWRKANPNWGVSVKPDDIGRLANEAGEVKSQLNEFLTKRLNVWTSSAIDWMDIQKWDKCNAPVDGNGLRGRTCFMGMDLSSTTDLSALVLVFPPATAGDPYQLLCRFFLPGENIRTRQRSDQVIYESWVRNGFVQTTPGNVIDHDAIKAQILEDCAMYDIREVAFDPYNATKLVVELQDEGVNVVEMRQTMFMLSAPTKELERLVGRNELAHGGHPVLRAMVSKTKVKIDSDDNIKPDKKSSKSRIDGVVATVMGLARAMVFVLSESVYEERGLRTIG